MAHKTWERPRLVVLLRQRPQETVLGACKYAGQTGAAPAFEDCMSQGGSGCTSCALLRAS
jgi:hypothetical protein